MRAVTEGLLFERRTHTTSSFASRNIDRKRLTSADFGHRIHADPPWPVSQATSHRRLWRVSTTQNVA
jgi:hypothetical protein